MFQTKNVMFYSFQYFPSTFPQYIFPTHLYIVVSKHAKWRMDKKIHISKLIINETLVNFNLTIYFIVIERTIRSEFEQL